MDDALGDTSSGAVRNALAISSVLRPAKFLAGLKQFVCSVHKAGWQQVKIKRSDRLLIPDLRGAFSGSIYIRLLSKFGDRRVEAGCDESSNGFESYCGDEREDWREYLAASTAHLLRQMLHV